MVQPMVIWIDLNMDEGVHDKCRFIKLGKNIYMWKL